MPSGNGPKPATVAQNVAKEGRYAAVLAERFSCRSRSLAPPSAPPDAHRNSLRWCRTYGSGASRRSRPSQIDRRRTSLSLPLSPTLKPIVCLKGYRNTLCAGCAKCGWHAGDFDLQVLVLIRPPHGFLWQQANEGVWGLGHGGAAWVFGCAVFASFAAATSAAGAAILRSVWTPTVLLALSTD